MNNIVSGDARKIEFKIPANIKHCNGLLFSGNVPGKANNNYMLGNVSLFFNNRQSHPLHYTIHSKPLVAVRKKREPLKLDEGICGGTYIQGYYVDLGTAQSFPYTVKIYLECMQQVETVNKN